MDAIGIAIAECIRLRFAVKIEHDCNIVLRVGEMKSYVTVPRGQQSEGVVLAKDRALRRQIERGVGPGPGRTARWAEPTVYDNGESYVFAVDVPGVKADDLTIDVHEATITVSATRTPTAPDGNATQRS